MGLKEMGLKDEDKKNLDEDKNGYFLKYTNIQIYKYTNLSS